MAPGIQPDPHASERGGPLVRDHYSGKTRTYGFDGTIHGTEHLDVEVDAQGNVVSVWFRCLQLPFQQVVVDGQRAGEMRQLYQGGELPRLHGVVIEDSD